MADREKVIKGLECCTAEIPLNKHKDDMCNMCPYQDARYSYCFHKHELMKDALELLKELQWHPFDPMQPKQTGLEDHHFYLVTVKGVWNTDEGDVSH